ncbi:DNA (cytosine-5-)-methyltransferase [Orobanche gracilis]
MCDLVEISDDEESCVPSNDIPISPKDENLNCNFPPENTCSSPTVDNVASSSGTNLRSSFIGMGFTPTLVDKAMEEHGEGNPELLLETLFAYSDHQPPKAEFLDDDFSSISCDDFPANHHVKEEPDTGIVSDGKKASLLKMKFSVDEVQFAMDRLGTHATVGQLMDFIFAARMAKKYEKDACNVFPGDKESEKDCSNEALFGIMEKTLQLLEMGFTENEISTAFEKCGSEAPLPELANSIVDPGYKYRPAKRKTADQPFDSFVIKTEEYRDVASQVETDDLLEKLKGKMPEAENIYEPNSFKKPKEEFTEDTGGSIGRTCLDARKKGKSTLSSSRGTAWQRQFDIMGSLEEDQKPTMSYIPNPCRSRPTGVAAKPPYFLYGNVTNLSHSSWIKITQFLYSIQPEFANTEMYSALSRTEGYVHNLSTEDRFHISPKGPMTIEEAIPHAKKWWPAWDNRTHINYINCDTSRVSHLCDRLKKILTEFNGTPPPEQQRDLIQQFQANNLVWIGRNKLGPLEPEQIERIMGYPLHHSRVSGFGVPERLESLKLSFQTDTLGYHLSVLRRLYPGGLTVFSFFSGIGGAEVALHRLGIRLKGVVSVETSEIKRKILKKWWENSFQSGELIQIDSIQKLSNNKLDELIKKFSGFDLIVCQNSYSDGNMLAGFDLSMFVEFVRVLQHVRSSR